MKGREATLSEAQVATYREQGYVMLRGFFDEVEINLCRRDCDRLERSAVVHPDNLRTHTLASARPPDRLDPVIDLSQAMRNVALSPRILAMADQLLGDEPLLFKDKLLFKLPGMKGLKAHQDYAYWHWLPAPPEALMTILVALDGANTENGAVEFFPGLHGRRLSAPGRGVKDRDLTTPGWLAETEPGDVVMFHSLTPHRSGDNHSSSKRRQLYLSYSAATYGDLYRQYYAGLHASVLGAMDAGSRQRAYFN